MTRAVTCVDKEIAWYWFRLGCDPHKSQGQLRKEFEIEWATEYALDHGSRAGTNE